MKARVQQLALTRQNEVQTGTHLKPRFGWHICFLWHFGTLAGRNYSVDNSGAINAKVAPKRNSARPMPALTHFARAKQKLFMEWFWLHGQPILCGDDMNIINVGRAAVSRYHQIKPANSSKWDKEWITMFMISQPLSLDWRWVASCCCIVRVGPWAQAHVVMVWSAMSSSTRQLYFLSQSLHVCICTKTLRSIVRLYWRNNNQVHVQLYKIYFGTKEMYSTHTPQDSVFNVFRLWWVRPQAGLSRIDQEHTFSHLSR